MKKTGFILLNIIFLSLLISCSGLFTKDNLEELAYLNIGVQTEDDSIVDINGFRTILPPASTLEEMTKIELLGKKLTSSTTATTKTYTTEGVIKSWTKSSDMLADKEISCTAGTWTFTLNAYKDSVVVYTGTLTDKSIVSGANSLAFTLNASTSSTANGSLKVTLYFPNDESIKAVKGGLTTTSGGTVSGEADKTLVIKAGTGTYEGKKYVEYSLTSLNKGSYIVKFDFYKDTMATQILFSNVYSEAIYIAAGKTSSATREIKTLNHNYTISYVDAPTFPDGSIVTFNEYDDVVLTTPAKTGYKFEGWYTTAELSGTPVTGWTHGTKTENVTLYAKWTLQTYSITYELNGGTLATSNPATYNVNTETFTLNNPTKSGSTFIGWYISSSLTGTKTTQITKGTAGNLTLYARWGEVKVVDFMFSDATSVLSTNNADEGINKGEKIALDICVMNTMTSNLTGVKLTLSSTSSYITFNDNIETYGSINSGYYKNTYIAQNYTSTSSTYYNGSQTKGNVSYGVVSYPGFYFTIASNAPDGQIPVTVSITSGTFTWKSTININVVTPLTKLEVSNLKYVDTEYSGTNNDGDGRIEQGEKIFFDLCLANTGTSKASNIRLYFSSSSSYVQKVGGYSSSYTYANYGTLSPGYYMSYTAGSALNYKSTVVFLMKPTTSDYAGYVYLNSTVPSGTIIPITVRISAAGSYTSEDTFYLTVN